MKQRTRTSRLLQLIPPAMVGLICASGTRPAVAQPQASDPPAGVGITERLNEPVPLNLQFTDETGRTVTLGDYFAEGVPVILTPVYYRCPNLCSATLSGLAAAMDDIEWSAGNEFQVVTFTIDPEESYQLADVKKRNYLTLYDRRTAAAGWHFLAGDQQSIEALTEALGFGYRYVERTGEYAHAPSIIVCTPDGRLSRYMNTVMPETETLRKALVEASQGTVGSPWDRLILKWCYTYDPSAGKYVVAARKVMFIGGVLTVVLIFGGIALLWRRELKSKRRKATLAGLQP